MTAPNILIIMSVEHDPQISAPYGHPFIVTLSQQLLVAGSAAPSLIRRLQQ